MPAEMDELALGTGAADGGGTVVGPEGIGGAGGDAAGTRGSAGERSSIAIAIDTAAAAAATTPQSTRSERGSRSSSRGTRIRRQLRGATSRTTSLAAVGMMASTSLKTSRYSSSRLEQSWQSRTWSLSRASSRGESWWLMMASSVG